MSASVASPQPSDPESCTAIGSFPLLALPLEMLNHVLSMLPGNDLKRLLPVNKFMAEQAMQSSAGRLTLTVDIGPGRVDVEAVRSLLLLAPAACLKLKLDGNMGPEGRADWTVNKLFQTPGVDQHATEFPCLLEVYIRGFTLPALVPAGLAASCPNLQSLHLSWFSLEHFEDSACNNATAAFNSTGGMSNAAKASPTRTNPTTVKADTGGRYGDSSSRSKGSSNNGSIAGSGDGTADLRQARQLHTLSIDHFHAPEGLEYRLKENDTCVKGLRSTVASVRCLKLHQWSADRHFMSLLGPQCVELHVLSSTDMLHMSSSRLDMQQLQKLVLPHVRVKSEEAADMEFLFSLPSLIHVELNSVELNKDYSQYLCKWQYLKLHLHGWGPLCLDSLSKLPLHTLTQPLALGLDPTHGIQVRLPTSDSQGLASLHRILHKLMKTGVHVMASDLEWDAQGLAGGKFPLGVQVAPAIRLAGPLLGFVDRVELSGLEIDVDVIHTLAEVYQGKLNKLLLHDATLSADMLPIWYALLAAFPTLTKVEICGHWDEGELQMVAESVRSLKTVMAQQHEGRCVKVTVKEGCCNDVTKLSALVLRRDAKTELVQVDIRVDSDYMPWDCEHKTRIYLTTGQTPSSELVEAHPALKKTA